MTSWWGDKKVKNLDDIICTWPVNTKASQDFELLETKASPGLVPKIKSLYYRVDHLLVNLL